MSDLDLDALEALAKDATPGPWEWEPEGFMGCGQVWTNGQGVEGGSIAGPTGDCYPRSGYSPKEDMQFIAAADPPTVLALIERVREAEAARAQLSHDIDTSVMAVENRNLQARLAAADTGGGEQRVPES